jgi:hypothetical protein
MGSEERRRPVTASAAAGKLIPTSPSTKQSRRNDRSAAAKYGTGPVGTPGAQRDQARRRREPASPADGCAPLPGLPIIS